MPSTVAPAHRLPEDVHTYIRMNLGWPDSLTAKVDRDFYLYHQMNWSQASWEEIREALIDTANQVCGGSVD